jgi:hypothetical protein
VALKRSFNSFYYGNMPGHSRASWARPFHDTKVWDGRFNNFKKYLSLKHRILVTFMYGVMPQVEGITKRRSSAKW